MAFEAFNEAYYQRYYHDPRTAVTSRAEMRARAELIAACVRYIGLPVARILDAGCGVGLLRAPLHASVAARPIHGARGQRIPVPALWLAAGHAADAR